jgi:hypothetical protein
MTVYIICGEVITARTSAPAKGGGRGCYRIGRGDWASHHLAELNHLPAARI